jgi:hypothetical protein
MSSSSEFVVHWRVLALCVCVCVCVCVLVLEVAEVVVLMNFRRVKWLYCSLFSNFDDVCQVDED